MTTPRDAIADFIDDYYYGEVTRETVLKDADAFLEAMMDFPESVHLALAAQLLSKPKLPPMRCDTCDNGLELEWIFCPWCAEPLPVPPSEDKT